MGTAVSVNNITKEFIDGNNRSLVLRGVSAEFPESEVNFLVGPSGCGKTTLLSIMAGLLGTTTGSLLILGEDLSKMTDDQKIMFRANNLGFIFQQFNLVPTLTASENVAIPLLASGQKWEIAIKSAKEMLVEFGLQGKEDLYPRHLSGGQQQRVAISRALVHRPKFLLCDEPTSALDHETGEKVMQILTAATKSMKTTLLVVTHDSRIYRYADSIFHMNDGVIIKTEKISKE